MQADSWHTDAAGYELIAEALLETLKRDEVCEDISPEWSSRAPFWA